MSAPQYCSRTNIPHNGHRLWLLLSPRGGHERRNILIDFHPYGYGTSIFTLGAPHEEGVFMNTENNQEQQNY